MYVGRLDEIWTKYFGCEQISCEKEKQKIEYNTKISNSIGFELHRPSIKGTGLLLEVKTQSSSLIDDQTSTYYIIRID